MPTLHKSFELTITPEQFLRACSVLELKELDILLSSRQYQEKITAFERQLTLEMPVEDSPENQSKND